MLPLSFLDFYSSLINSRYQRKVNKVSTYEKKSRVLSKVFSHPSTLSSPLRLYDGGGGKFSPGPHKGRDITQKQYASHMGFQSFNKVTLRFL